MIDRERKKEVRTIERDMWQVSWAGHPQTELWVTAHARTGAKADVTSDGEGEDPP